MKTLVCPDKFKHALDAAAAAEAIASGIRRSRPDAQVQLLPMADGGDGTGSIVAAAIRATPQFLDVLDPLGRPRRATWWRCEHHAVIEMAEASGLALLRDVGPDVMRASSFGTGQLIAAAQREGCTRIDVCVGGSATVDGGAGALQALGWRFLDAGGRVIEAPMCGGLLRQVHEVLPVVHAEFGAEARAGTPRRDAPLVFVLCDVRNPLLGANGAAAVFGPQKGASPPQVRELEDGLRHWCALLRAATGVDVSRMPHGGAAGGLAAGLHVGLGAELLAGFDAVARRVELSVHIRESDVVVTGEGRLDAQTREGKVVGGVGGLARDAGVPCVAFVGAVTPVAGRSLAALAQELGLRDLVVITPPGTPEAQALADTRQNLTICAAHYFHL